MNARVKPPAEGEAEIVQMPNTTTAEAPQPAQPAAPAPSPAPAAPAAAPQPAAPAPADEEPKKRNPRRLILMIAVPAVLVVGGGWFWLTGGRYEDTDNAYVTQPIVSISPDVAGRVIEIDAKENQNVKAGDVLFKLDPSTYQIALDQAKAAADQAKTGVDQANSGVDQANAAVAAARLNVAQLRVAYTTAKTKLQADQAALVIQQRTQSRNTDLASKGVATQTTVDQGELAVQQAQQAVDLDQQQVQGAIAALDGNPDIATDDHPSVKTALAAADAAKAAVKTAQAAAKTAEAAVAAAQLNLDKTTVKAPADGVVSQIPSFNVGQFVAAGTTIVSLVETGDTWVEANFKETQLDQLKVGQPATVSVDAYGGPALHGTVQSIAAATGAEFSLIPAQNATGNWVKVVQRVPVRIKVEADPDKPLRSGMSATVTVDTGRSTLDKMLGH